MIVRLGDRGIVYCLEAVAPMLRVAFCAFDFTLVFGVDAILNCETFMVCLDFCSALYGDSCGFSDAQHVMCFSACCS